MADNTFYISAGLPPNDNDPGDDANTFHVSAGLIHDDTESGILPINFTGEVKFSGSITRKRNFNRGIGGSI